MVRELTFRLTQSEASQVVVPDFQPVTIQVYNYSNYNVYVSTSGSVPNDTNYDFVIAPASFEILPVTERAFGFFLAVTGLPSVVSPCVIRIFDVDVPAQSQALPLPVGYSTLNYFYRQGSNAGDYKTTSRRGVTLKDLTVSNFLVPTGNILLILNTVMYRSGDRYMSIRFLMDGNVLMFNTNEFSPLDIRSAKTWMLIKSGIDPTVPHKFTVKYAIYGGSTGSVGIVNSDFNIPNFVGIVL